MSNSISKEIVLELKKVFKFTNKKTTHQLHEPLIEKKDINILKEAIYAGHVSSIGKHLKYFENAIKQITKSKNVCLTSSGSTALHVCLKALGLNENHEVLIPNLNYIASANSILMCNSTPHLIDVDEISLGIDVIKLDNYLTKNTYVTKSGCYNKKTKKKIKLCIALHPFGYSCEIQKLKKILLKRKILLLEDAAEAFGSYYKNKHLGTFGYAGIFSFNGNKTLTSGGGGAIISSNKKFINRCKHLTTTAKKKHKYLFIHDELGYNYRMPNINAALGYSQMIKLKKILLAKKKLNKKLCNIFKNSKFLKIHKDNKYLKSNNWLNILILKKKYFKNKNSIIENCIKENIYARSVWNLMSKTKYLKSYPKMNLKNSENLYKRIICLPGSPLYYYENEK